MKIELHMHTSRYSLCAVDPPEVMIERLVETGYEAVFITEHDAVWTEQELAEMQVQFPQIRLFSGLELTIPSKRGFGHLLILGTRDRMFLSLNDPGEILARARRHQCLTVLAHPYRWDGAGELLAEGYFPDAIEFRTPNHERLHGRMSVATADRLCLPMVNSGDVHRVDFINRFWIETREEIETPSQLRQAVLRGAYENCSREE
jgi:hypothetical protein